ncbi:hypothetical protein C8N46_101695 [Kordia periserrulae]|uniref:Uncharacterized protein n=1 Tax=Kordia periserrulae TaxID=701523 RepID=A0A2T6C716_9FLAO|nr:hypothetical protein [Kordia periserrulae]PTX64085.1 hypothetical protein C8N46_101695 [Kordia periserrulae]
MLDKLSHKRRFFLVVIVFVLLALAVYKKTYQPIFALQNELNASNQLIAEDVSPFVKIEQLQSELAALDKIVGKSEDNAFIQQKILDFITKKGLDVSVVNIADSHIYKGNAFTVYTNSVILKGDYPSLLQTIYTIEKECKASKIVSAKFYSKKNYSTNKTAEYAELYFQNYGK